MQSGARGSGTERPQDAAAARGTSFESKDTVLERGRAAVAEWREQNPAGTDDQLTDALGSQFPGDFGPVLRRMLFRYDQDHAGTTAPDRW